MMNFERVLAPTDFSDHSLKALRFAGELAERFQAELHLLHVLADLAIPSGPDPMLASAMPPEYYRQQEAQAIEQLADLIQPDWPPRDRIRTAVRWGSAVDEINAYSVEEKIDLLVIATHGRTGLAHVLLGSVAERIIREAPCPVLTIRDRK